MNYGNHIRAAGIPGGKRLGGDPARNGPAGGGRGKVILINVIVTALAATVMYQLFPQLTQNIVFDGILRKGWYTLPFLALAFLALQFYFKNRNKIERGALAEHRRRFAVFATLSVLYVLWAAFVFAGSDYLTYKTHAANFTERKGLIPADPAYVRFTPLQNACTDIGNSVSSTGEEVECKYVRPIIGESSFGYAAPITPSGVLNTFVMSNPGFMYLDDDAALANDPTKRLTRLDDVQKIGPGMEWFDNVQYALAKTDFFANYDTPHYLVLDPAQPRKLTLVAPKIKYSHLWRLPYWGGVVLVHSNGRIEDLTAAQALADSRLKDQWIFPESLARQYVELQNYKAGWGLLTPFVRVAGKLKIEELSGKNQFPFVTRGVDKRTYLVAATRGEGAAQGLFRMYYINAWNGEGSYHQFGTHEVVYGAYASHARLTNIPGYQWHRGSGDRASGTIVAIEPVYIVRPNDKTLYWKYTITNTAFSGISATAVTNSSRPDDIKLFSVRSEFERWLEGNDTVPSPLPAELGSKDRIIATIEAIARQLEQLKKDVEGLK